MFPKIGVPQNGWFILESPIKMDDLGVPLFSETSTSSHVYIPGDYSSHVFFVHLQAFGRQQPARGRWKHPWHTRDMKKNHIEMLIFKRYPKPHLHFWWFLYVFYMFLVYITSHGDEDQECTDPAIPHQDLVQSSGFSAKTLCTFLP